MRGPSKKFRSRPAFGRAVGGVEAGHLHPLRSLAPWSSSLSPYKGCARPHAVRELQSTYWVLGWTLGRLRGRSGAC